MMLRLWFAWIALAVAMPLSAQTVTGDRFSLNSGPCVTRSGSGTPEGAVLGNLCDTYHRTDSGALYLKLVGTATTTGWMLLSSTISTPPAMNLTLAPTGDLVTDPVGNDILPNTPYDINIGMLSNKYLTLHAAELWVETLVAQNTIATIGGRVLVAPTNILVADLGPGETTITVKYNNLFNGDRVYMEADGKVEFMAVASVAGGGGPYTYTVTRDLDGTGANQWYAGDAILNTGTTGNGFIDLYSVNGILSSGSGPSIVGNVRTGTTYNAYAPRWAIGNLNGLYGYASSIYGTAFGDAAATNVTVDATNGFRIRSGIVDKLVADTAGNLSMVGNLTVGINGNIRTAAATAFGTGTGFWLSGGPATPPTMQVLVVAGGGGGGGNAGNGAGGGAGGGVLEGTINAVVQAYTVTVGGGGAGGSDGTGGTGTSSVFGSATALGGGGGARTGTGPAGGSGGGGGPDAGAGGAATQGNSGGLTGYGFAGGTPATGGYGGGGGGAGGAGGGGTTGLGGVGRASTISGASVTYATGGVGNLAAGGNGAANTGDGGTSRFNSAAAAGNGGSGIVIVRYATGTITATGGTITTVGGDTVHTFTTSGTFTVTGPTPSQFRVGNPGGNNLTWDGSTLSVSGIGSGLTSISGGNITTGSITTTQIAANTIVAADIAAGTITATEIAAGTITADKLNVSTLSAITANLGTITAGSITGGTIDGATVNAGSGDEVVLNSSGITLAAGTGTNNRIKWSGGIDIWGTTAGTLFANGNISVTGHILTTGGSGTVIQGYEVNPTNVLSFANMPDSTGATVIWETSCGCLKKVSSSLRYKDAVQAWMPTNPYALLTVSPIRFNYRGDGAKDVIGFSAEDLFTVSPYLVNLDRAGRPDSLRQDAFNVYLLSIVKALRAEVASLKAQIP